MAATSNVITLTVKCDLDLDEIFGRVHVYTTQDKSMNWVLDEFCREKKVKRVSTFALRSATGEDYDLTKTIAGCNLGEGDLIYCYNKNPPKAKPPPRTRQKGSGNCLVFGILAAIFFVVALGGIIGTIVIYELSTGKTRQFTVVVDAGSTSSKIYLYSWPTSLYYSTGKVRQDSYDKIEPLTGSMEHPSKAAAPIVKSIKDNILDSGLLPSTRVSSSPLYLGATAGMRMMNDREPQAVKALYKALRRDLQEQLKLKIDNPTEQIRIISGSDEGTDAWITVNYLEGTFGSFANNVFKRSANPTIGALDLGGASTQISFVPNPVDVKFNTTGLKQLQLYGKNYGVYSHSFLCYGKMQAQLRLLALLIQDKNFTNSPISHPCYPTGYRATFQAKDVLMVPCTKGKHALNSYGFEISVPKSVKPNTTYTFLGVSDYSSCEDSVKKFFPTAACSSGSCSFNSVYQPPLHGQYKAFSGFYHVAKFFNATKTSLQHRATLPVFEDTVRRYCARNWNDVSKAYDNSTYTANYCFDGIYVQNLLGRYGFNNETWDKITFVEKIKDSTVGWSLGFAILQSGRITVESLISIGLSLFICLLVLFCIVFIVAIILAALAVRNRRSGRGSRFTSGGAEGSGYGSI